MDQFITETAKEHFITILKYDYPEPSNQVIYIKASEVVAIEPASFGCVIFTKAINYQCSNPADFVRQLVNEVLNQ